MRKGLFSVRSSLWGVVKKVVRKTPIRDAVREKEVETEDTPDPGSTGFASEAEVMAAYEEIAARHRKSLEKLAE